MSNSAKVDNPLEALADEARSRLAGAAHTPFSSSGFAALQDKIDQFVGDLILESVRIMKRRQSDTISPIYVQQASESLVANSRQRLFTLIGTMGGVFLGSGVSSYVEMAREGSTTVPEVLIASTFAVIGTFMIALQFARE